MSNLRYPIGKFTPVPGLTAEQRAACIDQVAVAPGQFRKAVTGLSRRSSIPRIVRAAGRCDRWRTTSRTAT